MESSERPGDRRRQVLRAGARAPPQHDFEVSAEVAYHHDEAHAAAGILFRFREDFTGYAVGLREIEKGIHPEFGPWERPVLQLFRLDSDGWKLLQESKVLGCRSGLLRRLKVVCRGPNIWVFYEDMATPVLKEFDDRYDRPGSVGLWKDHAGNRPLRQRRDRRAGSRHASGPAFRTDWSWVRGAVTSDPTPSTRSRCGTTTGRTPTSSTASWPTLKRTASTWCRSTCTGSSGTATGDEYLRRIDDFLRAAAAHGLKVNFILWDDCGHVEPSLAFAAPVPGRHNSQMMPNPSHRIRDSGRSCSPIATDSAITSSGIAGRFKDDERIAFWQLYNEGLGPKERYRDGEADANLNRLLGWTREWVKGTGTTIPGHRDGRRVLRAEVLGLLLRITLTAATGARCRTPTAARSTSAPRRSIGRTQGSSTVCNSRGRRTASSSGS